MCLLGIYGKYKFLRSYPNTPEPQSTFYGFLGFSNAYAK